MSPARILPATPEAIAEATGILARGGLVGMPTETVYGLAGDATNPEALARIFSVKERPRFDPLIVHFVYNGEFDPFQPLEKQGIILSSQFTTMARTRARWLAQDFWPGPLTLIVPRGLRIPHLATSGLDTVALRAPSHPVARALITQLGNPIAAPSANRFGRLSPTSAADVASELGDRIDLILDGGTSEVGVESTVVYVSPEGMVTLLRPGAITRYQLEKRLEVELMLPSTLKDDVKVAPGMLASHYAPQKPLHLLAAPLRPGTGWKSPTWPRGTALPPCVGLLAAAGPTNEVEERARRAFGVSVEVQVLSATGEAGEAAKNLFAQLRALDASKAVVLFAEPWLSHHGLAPAIADRLQRAAAK